LTEKNDLLELAELIAESKFTGKIEIYFNSGGKVGIKVYKPDKEMNKKLN
jgi:hypothetical protein